MKKSIILFIAFGIIASLAGCQKIKRIFIKPLPEGVVQESYPLRFTGYEHTVTVRATQDEFLAFMSDPACWSMLTGEMEELSGRPGVDEGPLHTGSVFPFALKWLGYEISGQMIVVKMEKGKIWFIWDNSRVVQTQRWNVNPVKDGISLTLKVETELPENLSPIIELAEEMEFIDLSYKNMDQMLANIQAHFDPSLDPEELVARGMRGEIYETFWQAHEASVFINGSLEDFLEFADSTEDIEELVGEIKYGAERLALSETITYFPVSVEWAGIKMELDTYTVDKFSEANHFITYIVWLNNFATLRTIAKPEAGGSNLRMIFAMELPGSTTPKMVDLLIKMTGIPKRLEKAVLDVKHRVEGVG